MCSDYVQTFYELSDNFKEKLDRWKPTFGYGRYGEFIFYLTYSRKKANGKQESWADVVIRCIEGTLSIRKDWYKKNRICWDANFWDIIGEDMAVSMFNMNWLPAGRGLRNMGTELIYTRGAMPLYNCSSSLIGGTDRWVEDLCWIMDSLMCGSGVGFESTSDVVTLHIPRGGYVYTIPDSREGWVESLRLLLNAFKYGTPLPAYDYSHLREKGALILTFGGIASGPEPLIQMHQRMIDACYRYINDPIYPVTMFKTDLGNMIGCAVVTGNVRRSAEIVTGRVSDTTFLDLKNYDMYPERAEWGWMSNNSVKLMDDCDFDAMDEIASRVRRNGEPGYVNIRNAKYGRIGKFGDNSLYGLVEDQGTIPNPCGEIIQEDKEVCNIADVLPTRCKDYTAWLRACKYATIYCSTVSLLPTHSEPSNSVIVRNRRIGVSIIDFSGWKHLHGVAFVTRAMREGYDVIRRTNTGLAKEAGVPQSIKVTTIKPGGTTTKLAGRTAGIGHPNFTYMLRRTRIQDNNPIVPFLDAGKIPFVKDPDSGSLIYEFPIYCGEIRPASDVSVWEQAMNLVLVQREWADNAVSNTLTFRESEAEQLEAVLSAIAPLTKSVSMLPYLEEGVYENMPEIMLTKNDFHKRVQQIDAINWSEFKGDGIERDKYCASDKCERA